MPREESATPAVAWRSRLEARWQAWLREVTELSLAYHAVAPASVAEAAGAVSAGGR